MWVAKVSSAARRWPNTLIRAWPVYISSMCAFRRPVVAHCARKCGWARLPIRVATKIESGTVTRAIAARSGEMRNIITSTPTIVSSEVTIWLSVCWMLWEMLSMSLVTRERISPRG